MKEGRGSLDESAGLIFNFEAVERLDKTGRTVGRRNAIAAELKKAEDT